MARAVSLALPVLGPILFCHAQSQSHLKPVPDAHAGHGSGCPVPCHSTLYQSMPSGPCLWFVPVPSCSLCPFASCRSCRDALTGIQWPKGIPRRTYCVRSKTAKPTTTTPNCQTRVANRCHARNPLPRAQSVNLTVKAIIPIFPLAQT